MRESIGWACATLLGLLVLWMLAALVKEAVDGDPNARFLVAILIFLVVVMGMAWGFSE